MCTLHLNKIKLWIHFTINNQSAGKKNIFRSNDWFITFLKLFFNKFQWHFHIKAVVWKCHWNLLNNSLVYITNDFNNFKLKLLKPLVILTKQNSSKFLYLSRIHFLSFIKVYRVSVNNACHFIRHSSIYFKFSINFRKRNIFTTIGGCWKPLPNTRTKIPIFGHWNYWFWGSGSDREIFITFTYRCLNTG